ncbi:ABC transporter substrate-binding protein [Marinitoga lauensis]|uniref:ABC transporter substrate-binding protein n=1 Tax=Marinitoga lauensis TaxID=2201189 RepID=UPI0010115A32|nr:ABC transporter substrate-binding protein [Marinitoga lauensis]
MKKFFILLMVTLFSLVLFSENIILQLKWFHQFQFAGFYVAKEKKFYSDYGLNVTIKQGGPTVSPLKEVLTGKAQFGLEGPNVIQTKAGVKELKL